MNTEPIKPFEGGVDKNREKLNQLVERVNELTKEIEKILNWPEQTMVVHDSASERLKRVIIKSCQIVADLGDIECDCPSNGEVGDA